MVTRDNSSTIAAELAVRIKTLRRTIRLSQTELAKRLGTRQSVVSRWEQGKHVPDDEFIERMA
ncbi:MAG TPA: helix-turn-helix transcriptional regulator, partial [Alphaproteobacteria bacterium]|nr:helix-turn-helix transcriptional regulator [Alphaproteobacteria bacterium]